MTTLLTPFSDRLSFYTLPKMKMVVLSLAGVLQSGPKVCSPVLHVGCMGSWNCTLLMSPQEARGCYAALQTS